MNAIRHEVETTYINEWVEMGAYELVVNAKTAEEMRRQRVDLVDINYVLRTGSVVQSDMLDSRGLWDVLGGTIDGDLLDLQIAVVSSQLFRRSCFVGVRSGVASYHKVEKETEMKMVQHGVGASTYVADEFEAEDIGAPFKVILHGAVKVTVNEFGECLSYSIPDLEGLIAAVVIARILHPRKLFGADIKFIRKAICLKQKDLASKLEMSPEYLSRCETGANVMAPSSEKLLRILSLKSAIKLHKMKSCDAKTTIEDALDRLFDAIKPLPVYDVEDVLELHFCRPRPSSDGAGTDDTDDGLWEAEKGIAA